MQPRNVVPLESLKQPQAKKSTVLQKVARKILAPIRNIPLPSSPTHSRNPSGSSTSSGRTQTPTTIVQMVPSGPRSQSVQKHKKSQRHVPAFTNSCGGVFVFPPPPAPPSVAPAPASPTSPIHRRRGAIVELPNEWYANAEAYNVLGVVRTRSRDGTEAERIRRVKSFGGAARSVGSSLLSGVRRGKSAQAALGVSAPPASTPALLREQEQEQDRDRDRDALDWRNSIGLSEEITISFDFEDELDADFEEV